MFFHRFLHTFYSIHTFRSVIRGMAVYFEQNSCFHELLSVDYSVFCPFLVFDNFAIVIDTPSVYSHFLYPILANLTYPIGKLKKSLILDTLKQSKMMSNIKKIMLKIDTFFFEFINVKTWYFFAFFFRISNHFFLEISSFFF